MAKNIVLTTEAEFQKGGSLFVAASNFDIQPVSAVEEELATAVLENDCRAVILGVDPYRGPLYESLRKTGNGRGAIIARFGVGHDGIDKDFIQRHGILLANTPGVLNQSVAEHAIWLAGSVARRVASSNARVKAGGFESVSGDELAGATLGIIGFGGIGRFIAHIAHFGFGMRVLATDCRTVEQLEAVEGKSLQEIEASYGLDIYTSDSELVLRKADVVSINLPATEDTRRFMNANRIAMMKPTAILVNTARGWVLDEDDLYDALANQRIAGAGLDVFENEPYHPATPAKDLRTLSNIVMTPHVGSNTRQSNDRMARACLKNITNFFAGRLDELTLVETMGGTTK